VVKDLNEEQEDVELETIEPTRENVLNIIRGSDEYFNITPHTFDIQAGDDFYILPDGSFLINTVYTDDGTQRETIDHSFVDKFLADAGITVPPATRGSTFFEEITNSIAITDGYNFTGINLGKVEPTEEQYKQLQSYLSKLDYKEAQVIVHNKKKGAIFTLKDSGRDELSKDAAHIINSIKQYYITGILKESILKEDIDHIEDEEVDLQPMSKEEVFKDVLETVKEKFEEYDITSKEEYLDVMLLPDGTALLPKLIKEEEDEDDSPTFGDYDLENFDFFLNDYGIEKEFPEFTGSIHFYTSHPEDESPFEIHLNSKEPTQKQYDALKEFAKSFIPRSKNEEDNYISFDIYKPNGKKVSIKINNSDKLINAIKRFYSTGVLKESIDHREVYKSLTFSDNPERGPIFISKEGKFANIGRFVTHAKIFSGQDYEGDDYYVLHDAFDLIKANGGNKFEPFAYIDLWKIPNPAQKKAIISWMYYLIEWGVYELMVNTSNSNETYNLTTKIPEETYDDITRGLLESKTEAVGHRNDEFFGERQRSLLRVIVHETTELGNIDIPDTVLKTFKHTEEQGKLLKEFIELIDSGDPIEDFDIYIETLMDVIHGEYPEAKYALWLCKTKDDVKKLYGGTDSNIGTYKIEYPKPISDLGEEGLLYVFSKIPERIIG
jgi:hypothetical protein